MSFTVFHTYVSQDLHGLMYTNPVHIVTVYDNYRRVALMFNADNPGTVEHSLLTAPLSEAVLAHRGATQDNIIFYCSESVLTGLSYYVPNLGADVINLFSHLRDSGQLFECEACGRVVFRAYHPFDSMCTVCHEEACVEYIRDDEGCSDLYDYCENVLQVHDGFITEPGEKHPLFLGVELEVEARDELSNAVQYVSKTLPDVAICKEDGSLGENGLEIVTVPASYKYHMKHMWNKFFEYSPADEMRGWNGYQCGMHVHIDRSSLSALTVGKMLVFINAYENVKLIQCIASRDFNSYCERHTKHITDGTARSSSHYDALSISNKNDGKTVELRIFRSNINKAGFYKNLDFCAALVDFCKNTGGTKLSHKDFIAFMSRPENSKEYKYLYRYLVQNSWINPKRKKEIKYERPE